MRNVDTVYALSCKLLDPLHVMFERDTEALVAEGKRWVFDVALHRKQELDEVPGERSRSQLAFRWQVQHLSTSGCTNLG